MIEFADLHAHSTASDGLDTPRELIDSAAGVEGLRVLALTDHDVVPPKLIDVDGAQRDPVEYAREKGILLLPGIEISCDTEVDDVHIVGLFCNFEIEALHRIEADARQSKLDGYKKLCELLCKRGMDVSWDFVCQSAGKSPEEIQRKHIFECIAQRGYTPDWKSAKIMVRDDPELNVKRYKPDPLLAIDVIHEAGGVAILAHPFLIDEQTHRGLSREDYIERLMARGLDGMEADYPYAKTSYKGTQGVDEITGYVYRHYGPRLKFLSGGSDYHAEYKKNRGAGRCLGDGKVPMRYFNNMILPYMNAQAKP